ncbi:TenA family protein [Acidisoma sp.]|uniref:TenA family protein n=1 Tax=Acidisoma sp. TaxID=1872115 RepID=UPI003B008597
MVLDIDLDRGLFGRLRRDAGEAWALYTRHPFLEALALGTLPLDGFRRYLIQDYLYLIQYARGYALGAYKGETLVEIRAASKIMAAILDVEMPLHIAYCAEWGLTEEDMAAAPEDMRMIAYTRFFLERGLAGDKLDLDVALAPCIVGYAEIAQWMLADPSTVLAGNPYAPWIEAYAAPEYREAVTAAIDTLEALGQRRGAEARYPSLLKTFQTATMLEAAFWGIGWPP